MSQGPDANNGGDGTNPPPPPGSSPPPAPQPAAGGDRAGRPADLGPRFLARLIDFILIGVVYSVLIVPVFVGTMFGMGSAGGFGMGGSFVAGAVSSLLGTAVTLAYFALMESNRGQTVGKMLLKLKVVGPGGGNPTMEEALKRNLWLALGLISIIPLIGWLLVGPAQLAAVIYIAITINNTADRKGWHDAFAGGTVVVHTE